jgi:cell wall-associated NlpC family hydrolase
LILSSTLNDTKELFKLQVKIALLGVKYWREFLIFCVLAFFLLFLIFFGGLNDDSGTTYSLQDNIAPEVARWDSVVREYVKMEGVDEKYVPVLLAVITQESGGTAADVMQSSESAGLPPGAITDPAASIHQGVIHWKRMLNVAAALGITDLPTIVQSYNYGPGWLYYINTYGKVGTEALRKQFAREHAKTASCGWRSPYCYGDYTYSQKVMNYWSRLAEPKLAGGDALFQQVMTEALKFEGWPYQWGGETPNTSFDCSGLTKWAFAAAGIRLPRTAQEQYQYTKRISEQELRPGDLVFFTGTSDHAFISHVGIYVGDGKMYNSNSSGVQYSDLTAPAWRSKIYGYGRVLAEGKQ